MPEPATKKPGFPARTAVVIPALNEEGCVGDTVRRWLALGVSGVRVVDNGSTDGTASIARASGTEVLTESRRGYGAAAWRGLQDWPAGCEWVLFSSADGSDRLSAEEAAAWTAATEAGAELVIGDRVALPASRRELKWVQRFGNRVTCEAIRFGWGRRFQDMGSLRLMRRDGLVALGLADRGFGWNVEMQVRAIEAGWRIVELPVTYYPRQSGESKISGSWAGTWRAGRGIVRMLALLWMLRRRRSEAAMGTAQQAPRNP
jgi:glycosyltransferase involved in cell wall biosynthesis